jgi:hypothetical protein
MTGAAPGRGVASGHMAQLHARSFAEAREYMILAMADCDGEIFIDRKGTFRRDGQLGAGYVARCSGGTAREFTFTLDEQPQDDEPLRFGQGSQPSRLLDAGQWYAILNRYVALAQQAQQLMTTGHIDEPTVTRFLDSFDNARAAAIEVLKFIPADEQAPPEAAYWSEYGQVIRRDYDAQITRPLLEQIIRDVDQVFAAFQAEADRQARGAGPS